MVASLDKVYCRIINAGKASLDTGRKSYILMQHKRRLESGELG